VSSSRRCGPAAEKGFAEPEADGLLWASPQAASYAALSAVGFPRRDHHGARRCRFCDGRLPITLVLGLLVSDRAILTVPICLAARAPRCLRENPGAVAAVDGSRASWARFASQFWYLAFAPHPRLPNCPDAGRWWRCCSAQGKWHIIRSRQPAVGCRELGGIALIPDRRRGYWSRF